MLFANFNQDFSCVSVGTKKGYHITTCDPFGRVYTKNDHGRGIVEMLFSTSLLVLVGVADQPQASPRKLQVVNTKRESIICDRTFPTSILAVKLNRKALAVVLENAIYIHDIMNMRLVHTVSTPPNADAVVALSPSSDSSYLAYPSFIPSPSTAADASPTPQPTQRSGDVALLSTTTFTVVNVIQAHKTPLSFLAMNSSGTLLATSSDKGTVIRVWSVPGSEKLYQFRRGTREAKIYSMNFDMKSTLLAVSSAHETVHIFKLSSQKLGTGGGPVGKGKAVERDEEDQEEENEEEAKAYGASGLTQHLRIRSLRLTKHLTSSVGGYLPNTVTEMWEPSRDFAHLRLPTTGQRSVVAISSTSPHVMVICSDGYFYVYGIDLENGGECTLIKSHNLLESGEESLSLAD